MSRKRLSDVSWIILQSSHLLVKNQRKIYDSVFDHIKLQQFDWLQTSFLVQLSSQISIFNVDPSPQNAFHFSYFLICVCFYIHLFSFLSTKIPSNDHLKWCCGFENVAQAADSSIIIDYLIVLSAADVFSLLPFSLFTRRSIKFNRKRQSAHQNT